jgi:hypothetical protein
VAKIRQYALQHFSYEVVGEQLTSIYAQALNISLD